MEKPISPQATPKPSQPALVTAVIPPQSLQPTEILITLPFSEEIIAPLRNQFSSANITLHAARRPEDVPPELWEHVQVLYTDRVLPSPEAVPNLRWLQFHSAGIDFALGSPLLNKPGLLVTTLSGAAAPQTAESALSAMLALGHHLPELVNAQSRAEWPRERWDRYRPIELRGSTVGIVGYGSIGRELARLLQPFGVQILAAKFNAMHPEDSGYSVPGLGDPEGNLFTRLYPYQALKTMLKACDFVVVATPLTQLTRGMFSAAEFEAMKPGACLIVPGRGGVVNEQALLEALQERRLAAAALDVFEEEPLSLTSPLWKQHNLLVTPHIAGLSSHYDRRAMDLFNANLALFLQGEKLLNLYDPTRGY
jgi:phosphoglycerate dehydrogenase-like enzyme